MEATLFSERLFQSLAPFHCRELTGNCLVRIFQGAKYLCIHRSTKNCIKIICRLTVWWPALA